jgi:hypothetical protein
MKKVLPAAANDSIDPTSRLYEFVTGAGFPAQPCLPDHIAPDVQRPDMTWVTGDRLKHLIEVVAPDADITVTALCLDRVVPALREAVAVNVRVATRVAASTKGAAGTENIDEIMLSVGI